MKLYHLIHSFPELTSIMVALAMSGVYGQHYFILKLVIRSQIVLMILTVWFCTVQE